MSFSDLGVLVEHVVREYWVLTGAVQLRIYCAFLRCVNFSMTSTEH